MASKRDEKIQVIERYATHLFYGAGPEMSGNRSANSFGATYSDGQARPVAGAQPIGANRPPARVAPISNGSNATNVRNENWRGDQVAFSLETRGVRNGSSGCDSRPRVNPPVEGQAGPGNASGPTYSVDMLRTLDALLRGPSAAR